MIPLFATKLVRAADKYAVAELKIPSIVLMENASLSVINLIKEYYPTANNVGIICGKGNNGGDGFASARHLINAGHIVTIIYIGTESELKGDAFVNYTILKNLLKKHSSSKLKIYKSQRDLIVLQKCDLIVDALLGTGTKGELRVPYKSIIQYLNDLNISIVSIDLPSGLNLDNASGSTIINADLTVTLADFKSGLFYGEGYKYAGEVVKGSIGIGPEYFDNQLVAEYLIEPEDAFLGLPYKDKTLHKYSNGKVLVVAGSGDYPGAAALTTNSVLRSGSGAVFLAYPKSVRSFVIPKLDEAILNSYDDNNNEILGAANIDELKNKMDWADLISIGPGLGRADDTVEAVEEILKYAGNKRIVIDADAIYAFSKLNLNKINLKNKVLTPHHAEFANLIGVTITELQNDILSYSREFALKHGCTLVLKGAPTIIFTSNGDTLINTSGNVGMAKFGTGDVLTGIIAGFSAISPKIEDSIISAVYLHGLSADLLLDQYTEFGITPTLIMDNLHNAISFLRKSFI
jgi:NAD(P)H-hydrate epimerase